MQILLMPKAVTYYNMDGTETTYQHKGVVVDVPQEYINEYMQAIDERKSMFNVVHYSKDMFYIEKQDEFPYIIPLNGGRK